MTPSDYPCLSEFLYQAIYVPEKQENPQRDIINNPELQMYIENFGTQTGDLGVVAEVNKQVVGVAWTRIISGFGSIDRMTPELAISLLPEFRQYGIGTQLMMKLFRVLQEHGYQKISLSTHQENLAVQFYLKHGFKINSQETGQNLRDDLIMVKTF